MNVSANENHKVLDGSDDTPFTNNK